MSRVFAYCRVSTADQAPENQVREIAGAGFSVEPARVIREVVSGSVVASQRKEFARLLDRLERGDVLVVTKLDRLGRSALDVRQTVDALAASGVRVHCLALGGVDLTSAAGKMTMQVIAAVAEFERDLLIERTQAGQARARAAGKRLGRPAALSASEVDQVKGLAAVGRSISSIAVELQTSRRTVQRCIARTAAVVEA